MSRNSTTPRLRSSRTATSPSLGSSSPLRNKLENKRTDKSSGEILQKDLECWNRFRECAPKIQSQNTEAVSQKAAMNQDESDEFLQNKNTMSNLDTEYAQQMSEELSESMIDFLEHNQSSQPEKSPHLGVEESSDCLEKCEENPEKVEEISELKAHTLVKQSIQRSQRSQREKPSSLSVEESNDFLKKSIYCLLCEKVLARTSSSEHNENEIGEAVICKNCYYLGEPDFEENSNETAVVDDKTSIDSPKECPGMMSGKDTRAWMSPENKVLPSKPSPIINKDEVDGNKETLSLDWYVLNKTREILTPKIRLIVAIIFGLLFVISMMYMVYPYALGYLKPVVFNTFPSLKNKLQSTEKHSLFKKLSRYVPSTVRKFVNKWYWYKKKN